MRNALKEHNLGMYTRPSRSLSFDRFPENSHSLPYVSDPNLESGVQVHLLELNHTTFNALPMSRTRQHTTCGERKKKKKK